MAKLDWLCTIITRIHIYSNSHLAGLKNSPPPKEGPEMALANTLQTILAGLSNGAKIILVKSQVANLWFSSRKTAKFLDSMWQFPTFSTQPKCFKKACKVDLADNFVSSFDWCQLQKNQTSGSKVGLEESLKVPSKLQSPLEPFV